jgi:hypothetical protein
VVFGKSYRFGRELLTLPALSPLLIRSAPLPSRPSSSCSNPQHGPAILNSGLRNVAVSFTIQLQPWRLNRRDEWAGNVTGRSSGGKAGVASPKWSIEKAQGHWRRCDSSDLVTHTSFIARDP